MRQGCFVRRSLSGNFLQNIAVSLIFLSNFDDYMYLCGLLFRQKSYHFPQVSILYRRMYYYIQFTHSKWTARQVFFLKAVRLIIPLSRSVYFYFCEIPAYSIEIKWCMFVDDGFVRKVRFESLVFLLLLGKLFSCSFVHSRSKFHFYFSFFLREIMLR